MAALCGLGAVLLGPLLLAGLLVPRRERLVLAVKVSPDLVDRITGYRTAYDRQHRRGAHLMNLTHVLGLLCAPGAIAQGESDLADVQARLQGQSGAPR